MMTRRDLLKSLLATPLAATLDVERLLWVPRPQILVPAVHRLPLEEINRITLEQVMPGIVDNFFTESAVLRYLQREGPFYKALGTR